MQNDKLEALKIKYFSVDGDGDKEVWQGSREVVYRDAVSGNKITINQARSKIMWSNEGLFVLWQIKDEHIWGTYKNNDDPIYNEEVVEMFIAKNRDVPKEYFEFQFSPCGVKFDARILNPSGDRHDEGFNVDVNWGCGGLEFAQSFQIESEKRGLKSGVWTTEAFFPWGSIGVESVAPGDLFRVNLFRIDGWPEQNSFQAWQPTFKNPPDFHVPEKFGLIELR